MSGVRSVAGDADRLESSLQAVTALVEAGRLAEAGERCRAILRRSPEQPEALHLAGLIAFRSGSLDEAAGYIQRALAERPDSAPYHCNLGLVQRAAGDRAAARSSCERARALDPSFGQAHYNLGVLSFDDEDYEQARTHYDAAIVAEPRLREAHYNLGHTLQRLGREGEAIDAYRHAVEVDPSYARAWLNLANALHCEGCWEEALHAYQRFLELRPEHPSALHMIAAIEGRTTDRCPPQFVAELFDSYADEFDEVLVEDLGYQTPSAMARVILEEQPGRHFERILDLGCGTGLVGQALRPHGRRLIGVDLSSEMIAQAAARGVYDELIQAELVEFLVGAAESFDLIVAADVFVYLGDLEPVVSAAHGLVAPRGRFAFSTEASASEGFALRRSGRFAHHFRYVEQLVGRYGFGLATRQDLTLRHDHGEPVAGHLFLLCA